VIVESVSIKIDAFRGLYANHGEDVVSKVLAHHAEHGGISRVVKIRDCHRIFLGIELSEHAVDVLAGRYAKLVEDAVAVCESVPGAEELLQNNKGARRFYVVSGTPEDELRRITDRRGISGYFEAIYGSPRGKEEIVEDVLRHHGLTPPEALFVGDTMTDYRAAMATKVPFIGRVEATSGNPFPEGVTIVSDMAGLAAHMGIR